tara:strand:- start:118 stop:654 length:537 start_codon:yes stop_codon:yes gene_type:complete
MSRLEDMYWQQVEEIGWDGNYKGVEQYLKEYFKPSEAQQLADFVDNKVIELGKRFNDDWLGDPGIDVSDDSWGDLRNEVVGRGKEFYENITVAKLQEMANTNDYNESFAYCFTFLWTTKPKPEKTQFEINKPKRINEFIKKLNNLYDEYHAELYLNNDIFNYINMIVAKAIDEKDIKR